ncbi:unnamed protein product [Linum trigynum]|uniref:Uncharacterized protein n=1 Tax=Linum trigynum TaxID=586398 RepID=A0AAV2F9K8_9ROSI
MAVTKLLLSQFRRHFTARVPCQFFLRSQRWFSSDSDPNPVLPPRVSLVLVQPVSYAPKPKQPEQEPEAASSEMSSAQPSQQQEHFTRRPGEFLARPEARSNWTREEARYVKDAPTVVPVSYTPRVAPLPEDRVGAEGGEGSGDGVEGSAKDGEDMKSETRRILSETGRKAGEDERVLVPVNFSPWQESLLLPSHILEVVASLPYARAACLSASQQGTRWEEGIKWTSPLSSSEREMEGKGFGGDEMLCLELVSWKNELAVCDGKKNGFRGFKECQERSSNWVLVELSQGV